MLTVSIELDGKEVLNFSALSMIAKAALHSDIRFLPGPGSVITCTLSDGTRSLAISEPVQEEEQRGVPKEASRITMA